MTDNRKSSITAKVAAQIVVYYKLALKSLDAACSPNVIVGNKKYKVHTVLIDSSSDFLTMNQSFLKISVSHGRTI